jgi:anion-transporting  ArsA/GET3 family ATPase
MDFLNAPLKLATLFNDNVAKWFRDPEGKKSGLFGSLLQTGTKQVLKILESLTGSNFIHELSEFFMNIEQWQEQLQARTTAVQRMLVSKQTNFCLVTSFDSAKLKEAEYFAREIRKGGYHLQTLVLNRSFPTWLNLDKQLETSGENAELVKLYKDLKSYYQHREELYVHFEKRWGQQARIFRIPDMVRDISDLSALKEMTHLLSQGEKI